MASDMVPNHTGMDAKWVVEKPDLFVQTRECPYPGYDFSGENLSHDSRIGVYLENHYYSKTDCAVVFKRVDHRNGDVRYIYHGNDGTGMPWNDTAQIDFLNPAAREEVIQEILHVARNFPIIRFDAAMVLAKKHIQRLWYPEPGSGGDIASRSRYALARDEFEKRIPEEFWREVVDRCAKEIPDTLLLAEAFWMMEGYFVRTLGMHRVYNSAFMNMLKREDNAKYRSTIKNTIEFEPEILKRYVNFMNNPDEETASVQFGNGDKYFGVCTMMIAMPGLPMFGHGQVEGFEEKYGMEYRKAYRNETPNQDLINRHRWEIFPLMKKRYLFAGVENFCLYDFWENGHVNENVFVWSNRVGTERALIFYNNIYQQAVGWVQTSAASAQKQADGTQILVQKKLAEGLGLENRPNRFCIMQEQRSGLWYIRTTAEIFEKGMFASLNGFQTQVFVNIYEMDDNQWGHYRTLYETLNGRGIRDIHMGIQNIFLKDLYAALAGLATPAYFSTIREFLGEKNAEEGKIAEFIAGTEKPARAFLETVLRFLAGNYGAREIPGMEKAPAKLDVDALWNSFEGRLEKTLRIAEVSSGKVSGFTPDSVRLADQVWTYAQANREMPAILGAAVILMTFSDLSGETNGGSVARKLLDLWSMDRKMADILADSGMDGGLISGRLQTLKTLLVLGDIGKAAKADSTNEILAALFTDEDTKRLMGVHSWEGVFWFRKESAEDLLTLLLSVSAILGLPGQKPARAEKLSLPDWNEELVSLSKMKKKSLAAFADSGYKVEALLAEVAPAETKKKAPAKPAAVKVSAEKTKAAGPKKKQ